MPTRPASSDFPDQQTRRATRVLRQHVETDRLLGAEAVPMGTKRRAARAGADGGAREAQDHPDLPPPSRPQVRLEQSAPPSSHEKQSALDLLNRDEVVGCRKCALCQGRTNTVFGEGDPNAALMFVGEGPGQNEDEQGRPFVGRAGELLDKQIAAMGLRREDVYIANIVKCRPPDNRTPAPDEVSTCFPYLLRQIEVIGPKVIVTLGAPATKALLDTKEGITKIRGQWHQFQGLALRSGGPVIPVMPTFHPAYLLRAYTVENRKKVWSDLQAVMAFLSENP
jgi:DNA polymerase